MGEVGLSANVRRVRRQRRIARLLAREETSSRPRARRWAWPPLITAAVVLAALVTLAVGALPWQAEPARGPDRAGRTTPSAPVLGTREREPLAGDLDSRAVDPSAQKLDPATEHEVLAYTVAEGDTLLGIAEKLEVDPEALLSANQIPDADLIVAGDELRIPLWARPALLPPLAQPEEVVLFTAQALAPTEQQGQRRSPLEYEIAPANTLEDIAWRFGVDTYTLVNNNDIADPDLIAIGATIRVPPISGLLYEVQPGDTLSGIAQQFRIDLGPVIDFNKLEDADYIFVGMELILPGAAPLPSFPPAAPASPGTYEVAAGDTLLGMARKLGIDPEDILQQTGSLARTSSRWARRFGSFPERHPCGHLLHWREQRSRGPSRSRRQRPPQRAPRLFPSPCSTTGTPTCGGPPAPAPSTPPVSSITSWGELERRFRAATRAR